MNSQFEPPTGRSPAAKALRTVTLIASRPMRMTEIAERLGMVPSTASRTLRELVDQGWAIRDDDGLFSPGPALQQLIGGATNRFLALNAIAAPLLAETSRDLNLMVNLQVPHPGGTQVVRVARPDRYLNVLEHEWDVVPLHSSAGGGAMLLTYDATALAATEREVAVDFGPGAVDSLRARLAEARSAGYSYSQGAVEELFSGVGVPVRGSNGRAVAAIVAVGISHEVTADRAPVIADRLHACADGITARLAA